MLTTTALIALSSMIPLVWLLCISLPFRRAVMAAYLVGWLFLPQASIRLPGALPNLTRSLSIGLGVFTAMLLLDLPRLKALRPHWLDAPMFVWCVSPFFASITNGLGPYDGVSESVATALRLGVPYVIGRACFGDSKGLRMLALGLVLGGLIYVPLCVYEARMSPQLHNMVYGYHQHSFSQTRRMGGWRPMVFMQTGLAVGLFMSSTALLAGWLWATKSLGRFQKAGGVAFSALLLTAVACRSTGSLILLGVGGLALVLTRVTRSKLPILVVALVPLLYTSVRSADLWEGEGLVPVLEQLHAKRAKSVAFRLRNESLLVEKAMQKPVFGWGGWGRYRIYDADGRDISITDGLWVIRLGKTGFIGLAACVLAFLLPVLVYARVVPISAWGRPAFAPATGLSVVLSITMIDNLPNAMFTPFMPLIMGGLATFLQALTSIRKRMAEEGLRESAPADLKALAVSLEQQEPALAELLSELLLCLDATQIKRFAQLTHDDQVQLLRRMSQSDPE